MDLNETWKNCMSMWRWISENWKPGMSVSIMKHQWLSKHGYTSDGGLDQNCFFCEYDVQLEHDCENCPGTLVDDEFYCGTLEYCFRDKPHKFYLKLRRLNYKRLKNG